MVGREEWPLPASAGTEFGLRLAATFNSTLDTRHSKLNMPSYLGTGGAGFIGSHLAEELVRRGHRVRVVDNLITGKLRNLDHVPGLEFIEGDLADLAVAQRAAIGMDF